MITILLFSFLQEAYGKEKLVIDMEEMTVSQLKELLSKEYGLPNMNQVMIAVNEEFASDNMVVRAGDIVACIPPVSGG
ncbi:MULTISPECIES: molybdopterin converting factor subunit 1 [Bacillus]|uniref:molybdopterin converting factor subunit 1 n=1 Tax=Bacillus TaxID=1386 RepID=UPI000BB6D0D1|nr:MULTISPECIES: molybdopterin converting factor subunit 1 [Bacillus]